MDPRTGAILAMASYPSYDANQYRTIAAEDPSVFIDPIVSYVYEPGSVFKMLTALAALEQGTIDLSTPILDRNRCPSITARTGSGRRRPHGRHLASSRRATSWPSRATSARPGSPSVWAGRPPRRPRSWPPDVDQARLWGQQTGVDLAGEAPGPCRDPALQLLIGVGPILANPSFGQGDSVDPYLQLNTAFQHRCPTAAHPSSRRKSILGCRETRTISRSIVTG